jgi:hypothetical protein
VPPPKPAPERSSTTQFLSEADLIPPDRPPPMPPPIPGSTGKHLTVPGAATVPDAANGAGSSDTKKDDAG